jgi:hypothetical protein
MVNEMCKCLKEAPHSGHAKCSGNLAAETSASVGANEVVVIGCLPKKCNTLGHMPISRYS